MFKSILKTYQKKIDATLHTFFENKIKEIEDPFLRLNYGYAQEFVMRPGKRIRPISSLIAYDSYKGDEKSSFLQASIAPELFHASSLAHDDIMDEDFSRRNKPTLHILSKNWHQNRFGKKTRQGNLFTSESNRFGTSMAIMHGNIIYSLAFDSIYDSKLDEKVKLQSIKLLNNAYRRTNEGQMLDILLPCAKNATITQYERMALGKTAEPFAAAVCFGALAAHANKQQIDSLQRYALRVGLAFQLYDDILDLQPKK